jgi:hypothetical protein
LSEREELRFRLGIQDVAPRAGLEPATYWLTASCSTD